MPDAEAQGAVLPVEVRGAHEVVQEKDKAPNANTIVDDNDTSSEDASDESDAEPAAVLTRERRTNAGNRYSKLLAAEERADEDAAAEGEFYTAEGWQEQADDEAFSGSEADAPDDISLNSSSSDSEDEDDGADDQGEKDLRKQERQERAGKTKKRKTMQDVYKPRPPKRPRVAASAMASTDSADGSGTPTLKPKKKSERVSWIPAEGEGPQRQSSRKLAVENKVRVHERLEKAERHRLRTLAIMQAADRRKAAVRAKEMTQEERLAEAMTIEKKNSKSLNRWEESERLREEERKERLAAMKNRKLEGPFIRYWSGQAVWCADKLRRVGKGANIQEIEERVNAKEQEKFRKQQEREKHEREAALQAAMDQGQATSQEGDNTAPTQPGVQTTSQQNELTPSESKTPPLPQPTKVLDGIHDSATQPGQAKEQSQDNAVAGSLQPPANGPTSGSASLISNGALPPLPPLQQHPPPPQPTLQQPTASPAQPPPHYTATLAAATLVVLESFPSLNDPTYTYTAKSRAKDREEKDRNTISRHLVGFDQPAKGTKYAVAAPTELCEITSRTARYRDPLTGLAYADGNAFKSIRKLVGGGGEWSALLGAFVGSSEAARGAPEGIARSTRQAAVV